MTKFLVRQVEYGGDVDGTGCERWLGTVIEVFDNREAAEKFVDQHYEECEVVEQ